MFHHLDFQSKNFSYAIFIVKKWPLYVNFSIPPCGKCFFSQCSTPLVGMRIWAHSISIFKMVFLAFKTLLSP
jgi:hypothetical protein